MSKKATTFDKIQRALFAEPGSIERKLSLSQEKIKERCMKGFTIWLNTPSLSDKHIVRFLINECNVERAQAYKDLQFIKRLLGNVTNPSKEWARYMVIEMEKEAFQLAKLKKDPKAMAIAADKIGKYYNLDKIESEISWDQLTPPNFEPSPDISILGFKPDPNIEERRRKMREKYLQKFDPNTISDAEIIDN